MAMPGQAKNNPPFRAEHIGSLRRPRELLEAYKKVQAHEISAEAFRAVQEKCIRAVVQLQEDVGLQSITDGEFRRASYWSHFVEAVDGFTVKEALFTFKDEGGITVHFMAPHAEGKLQRARAISTEEFKFLKSTTKRTPKITMPSPSTMHFWRRGKGVEKAVYPDQDEFFADLARIYREELADLAALGASYIQMDEVPLAMLCDPHVCESVKAGGEDPEWLTGKYIDLTNAALEGKPEQLTVGMHLCRGNYKAKWLSEGGYHAIADRLFNRVNVDAYFLEYDTPRAGDFQPLRYMPSNKTAILGLVSTKTPQLESAEVLKRRVDEAGRFVPLDQLAISPQCGFSSTVAGNPVGIEDQIKKLRLVVDVANQIWQ